MRGAVQGRVWGLLALPSGCVADSQPADSQPAEGLDSYCVDVQDDPNGANHVQPYHVWVDAPRRQVWSVALETPTIAVFNADTQQDIQRIAVADKVFNRPSIVTDDVGMVWVSNSGTPPLLRYDPTSGEVVPCFPLDGVHAMVPRAGGGVVVFGVDPVEGGSGDSDWVMINRDKTELQRTRLDGAVVDRLPIMDKTVNAQVARITDDRQRLWFADGYAARVCGFPVASVLDGEP